MSIPSFAAVITAAGKSERFDEGKVKKEYLSIDGRSVLFHATEPFTLIPSCAIVIVTCPRGEQDQCAVALGELYRSQRVPLVLCDGGETRRKSVLAGLSMLKSIGIPVEFVAIHDGARCFIDAEVICATLATAALYGGSAPATAVTDATKQIDERGIIVNHLKRHGTVSVQTPQIFRYPDILIAHEKAEKSGKEYIDDTEIFTDAGYTVCVCPGSRKNRKVTYREDVPDAEAQIKAYLEAREKGIAAGRAGREFRQAVEESKRRIRG